jgi:hypothetical protein
VADVQRRHLNKKNIKRLPKLRHVKGQGYPAALQVLMPTVAAELLLLITFPPLNP